MKSLLWYCCRCMYVRYIPKGNLSLGDECRNCRRLCLDYNTAMGMQIPHKVFHFATTRPEWDKSPKTKYMRGVEGDPCRTRAYLFENSYVYPRDENGPYREFVGQVLGDRDQYKGDPDDDDEYGVEVDTFHPYGKSIFYAPARMVLTPGDYVLVRVYRSYNGPDRIQSVERDPEKIGMILKTPVVSFCPDSPSTNLSCVVLDG